MIGNICIENKKRGIAQTKNRKSDTPFTYTGRCKPTRFE